MHSMLLILTLILSPIPDIREATLDLALHDCPSQSCEVLSVISEGEQMTGFEDSQKLVGGIVWLQVIYNGVGGWVDSRYLIRIYPAFQEVRYA